MPLYGLFILFYYEPFFEIIIPIELKEAVFKVIIAATIVFPMLTVIVFKLGGTILTYSMTTRQERRFPFLLTAIFYMFSYYLLRRLSLPTIFYKIMLGATLSVTVAVMINLFWKVSIHCIGIGGLVGSLILISQLLAVDGTTPIIAAIILAGIIGAARLSLEEHTPSQIYCGLFIGFACEFGMLWMKQI